MQPGVLPWTKQTAAILISFQGDRRPQLMLRPQILSIVISCGRTGHVHLWAFRRTSQNVPWCALCLFQWLPNEPPPPPANDVSPAGSRLLLCLWFLPLPRMLTLSGYLTLQSLCITCTHLLSECCWILFLIDNMMPVHSKIILMCVKGQEMKAKVLKQDFPFSFY